MQLIDPTNTVQISVWSSGKNTEHRAFLQQLIPCIWTSEIGDTKLNLSVYDAEYSTISLYGVRVPDK